MRADLSRVTFDPQDRYEAVVLQQGRPLMDADFNEQAAIERHRTQQAARDAFGPVAAPRDGGGFEVAIVAAGRDLAVLPGRLYASGVRIDHDPQWVRVAASGTQRVTLTATLVDGRPLRAGDPVWLQATPEPGFVPTGVVMEAAVTSVAGGEVTVSVAHGWPTGAVGRLRRRVLLTAQPWSAAPVTGCGLDGAAVTAGRYAVVLEAVEAGRFALDRPGLADPALGGPDPSTRLRWLWRVALARVADVGSGKATSWRPPVRRARLTPSLRATDPATGDCALPPLAAYRGVRNNLYRFEVAAVRSDGSIATLAWDRDNASTQLAVRSISGSTVRVASFGPRGAGEFAVGQLVSIEPVAADLDRGAVLWATVTAVDPADLTVTLSTAPSLPPVVAGEGALDGSVARLRRWCGRLDGLTADTDVAVEDGLWVRVSGPARLGDFWTMPARSALGGTGTLDWPAAPGGFAARDAQGPERRYALLAGVDFDGTTFSALADLRPIAPSLTTLTAGDVAYDNSRVDLDASTVQEALEALGSRRSPCTVTIGAGDDWASKLRNLPAGTAARICFGPGTYTTRRRVVLDRLSSVVIEGVGPGTVLEATHDEVALATHECAHVTVRDLAVRGAGTALASGDGLGGALLVRGVTVCQIERVIGSVGGGSRPMGACLSVLGAGVDAATPLGGAPAGEAAVRTRVTVRDCTLLPGEYQLGLRVQDSAEVLVEGVVVQAPAGVGTTVAGLSAAQRLLLRGAVVARIGVEAGAAGTPTLRSLGTSRVVTIAGIPLTVPGRLVDAWQTTGQRWHPTGGRTAKQFLLDVADDALRDVAPDRGGPLRAALDAVLRTRSAPSWQGIVVAGAGLGAVTVRDCRVAGAIQGVHVGTSVREASRGPARRSGRVTIVGNSIETLVPVEGAAGRHGIYVANAERVCVAENSLTLTNQALRDVVAARAVQVCGYLGPDIVVRDNASSAFPIGISLRVFGERSQPLGATRWIIRGNLAAGAATVVETAYTRVTARAVLQDNQP